METECNKNGPAGSKMPLTFFFFTFTHSLSLSSFCLLARPVRAPAHPRTSPTLVRTLSHGGRRGRPGWSVTLAHGLFEPGRCPRRRILTRSLPRRHSRNNRPGSTLLFFLFPFDCIVLHYLAGWCISMIALSHTPTHTYLQQQQQTPTCSGQCPVLCTRE
jgi:hypothetical protein